MTKWVIVRAARLKKEKKNNLWYSDSWTRGAYIPIYLVTEPKAMNGPIVAIACVSSRAAQILHCHPLRPIQSNHRINANGRFESISGLDVNNLWSRGEKKKQKQNEACFAKFCREAQRASEVGQQWIYASVKQFTVWPSNLSHESFPDWNECRVSLEQDNLLSPHFKLLLFICHVRYEYTGSM